MKSFKVLWVFSFIVHHAFIVKVDGAKSLVPSLYVFGESSVDVGNNNNLITHAKANVPPNGIDFNNNASGRFTNGKYFADLIGMFDTTSIKLGLPLQLSSKIKTIYNLGARKFVVGTINQVGCSPNLFCNETINQMVKSCSNKLIMKVQKMEKQFSGSMSVSTNSFNFSNKIKNDPKKYGFTNISKSCIQEGIPCANRKEYYFWDFGHVSEAAIKIYADECFNGSKMCFPNVKKLAHAHL